MYKTPCKGAVEGHYAFLLCSFAPAWHSEARVSMHVHSTAQRAMIMAWPITLIRNSPKSIASASGSPSLSHLRISLQAKACVLGGTSPSPVQSYVVQAAEHSGPAGCLLGEQSSCAVQSTHFPQPCCTTALVGRLVTTHLHTILTCRTSLNLWTFLRSDKLIRATTDPLCFASSLLARAANVDCLQLS